MPSLDFDNIDVLDFLECLDIVNVSQATQYEALFSCPFPGHNDGDDKPSAYMNMETTAFFCHACHAKGNAVTFTARLLGISPLEATRMIRERYQPGGINPDAVSMVEVIKKMRAAVPVEEPTNAPLPEEVLDRFAVDWEAASAGGFGPTDYMFERGFDAEALDYWDFGYDQATDRITFAVRDEFGHLVGIKGRAWNDRKPKYLVLGDQRGGRQRFGFPLYMTSQILFGLHEAISEIETLGPDERSHLILVEGELNVVAMWQKGYRNVVAVNGSHFSPHHEKLLLSWAEEVTIFFDSDAAGDGAAMGSWNEQGEWQPGIMQRLKDNMAVRVAAPHEGDPATMSDAEIASALADSKSYLQLVIQAVRS